MLPCPHCGNLNPPTEARCFRCQAPLAPTPTLPRVPLLDGRYQVEALLGVGATGRVFCALDTRLNRRVALKVLSSELIHHPTARVRMEMEAKALANINHPNVIKINNVFTLDQSLVLDLELVTGPTLAERIGARPVPLEDSLRIMSGILSGLQAIHSAGLVHRDMKPANVLMTDQGEPKIADLGIAHQLDGARITRVGVSLGTAEYMSPEQVRGLPVSLTTDIYACGVILYEMLLGRPPFGGASEYEVTEAQVNRPPDLDPLSSFCPPNLVYALARALEKRSEQRWPTAFDFLGALQADRATQTPPVPGRTSMPFPPQTGPHPSVPGVTSLSMPMPQPEGFEVAVRHADPSTTTGPTTLVDIPTPSAPLVPQASPAARPRTWPLRAVAIALGAVAIAGTTTGVYLHSRHGSAPAENDETIVFPTSSSSQATLNLEAPTPSGAEDVDATPSPAPPHQPVCRDVEESYTAKEGETYTYRYSIVGSTLQKKFNLSQLYYYILETRVANHEPKPGKFSVTAIFVDRGSSYPQSSTQVIGPNGTGVFAFRYDRKHSDVTATSHVVAPTETIERDVIKYRTVRKCE